MKPITAKEFLTLEPRDFANGNVRDAIYTALKEREELIKKRLEVDKKFVEKWVRLWMQDDTSFIRGELIKMLKEAGVSVTCPKEKDEGWRRS